MSVPLLAICETVPARISLGQSSARFGEDRRLLVWMALFALVYLLFYPKLYTSVDEASTFRMAYLLRHGSVFTYDNGFFPSISPPGPHGRLYRFPIGFPVLLAPLTLFGWRALFLLNPVMHLVATWFFARLLRASRMPTSYAVLYLLYPGFVLFDRTLCSDGFAASLTTIALSLLPCRRAAFRAGLCLGLALLTRSASLPVTALLFFGLLAGEADERGALRRSRALRFVLGVLPFCVVTALYNWATKGSIFKSSYSADLFSLSGLWTIGPLYALSLLLFFPGMLLAPFLYRGRFWRVGLLATTAVVLLAAAYNESTYGNNLLETLLSTQRQVLPVMPFYLLAYCGVLARWLPEAPLRRLHAFQVAGSLLFVLAVGISYVHQKYLLSLTAIQSEVASALPSGSMVYANKDAYKLHQPVWDKRAYRELPYVSGSQVSEDLRTRPVFVVLFVRSRGFSAEDADNARMLQDLRARFRLAPGPDLGSDQLQCERVLGVQRTGGGAS